MIIDTFTSTKTFTLYGKEFKFGRSKKIANRAFPDFFVVGPQRTGTTWLWSNIRFHPEILMAEPKEPHYFFYLEKNKTFSNSEFIDYLDYFRHNRKFRKRKRFFIGNHYKGTPITNDCVGEASASYSVLNEDTINFIKQINPNIKVIISVRNPIERAWSNMKFDLLQNSDLESVNPQKIVKFYNDRYQKKCGRYTENIERWINCIGEKNVLLMKFEDTILKPRESLEQLFSFLELKKDKILHNMFFNTRAESKELEITYYYKKVLTGTYRKEIISLKDNFNIDYTNYLDS